MIREIAVLTLLFSVFVLTLNGQGLLLMSEDEISDSPQMEVDVAGFSTNFPSRHNMLKYAPPALYQEGGTCVGFAATYCAQSTMMNKSTGTTHPNHKYVVCMDPYFIYSLNNSGTLDPCNEGMHFVDLIEGMEAFGNMRDLYPPDLECSSNWLDSNGELDDRYLKYFKTSLPFRISEWGNLDLSGPDWKNSMKYFLSNDIPVIIGAMINDDFSPASYGGQIGKDGLWNYTSSNNGELGGHAMCVIGYDDTRSGGAFLVRNSWGNEFGLNGNVWIKYNDFRNVVAEAWVIVPENYLEYEYSSGDYEFEFKDIGLSGVTYGRAVHEGVTYEGLYAEGEQVWAFELYADGGVYFGQFIDFVKHGKGVYFDENSERYKVLCKNGEAVDVQKGFASSEGSEISREDEEHLNLVLGDDDGWLEFDGELPNVNYRVKN